MRKLPNERPVDEPQTPVNAGAQDRKSGSRRSPGHDPERKCILSGRHAGKDDLVRLAIGPDGQVAPDVRAKAPGRGAWIGVDRATLEAAQAKGKLKGALMRAFKTNHVVVPEDLGARIGDALRQAVLDRLGLEARSGNLLTGSEKIEVAARRGEVHLLLHASDAGEDGSRKLDQAWRMGDGEPAGLVFPEPRPILSLALGRQNVVHVALIDAAAAARVRQALGRWRAFIGTNDGLSAEAASRPGAPAMDVNEG